MPTRSYGDILRSERERNGYDLSEMSRRLHIRPDILHSIECADFDRMPARGYSKNMVRAYARALGLNERDITSMFLDEVNMHETGMPSLATRSSSGSRRRDGRSSLDNRSSRSRNYDGRTSASDARRDSFSSRFDDDFSSPSRRFNENNSSRRGLTGTGSRSARPRDGRDGRGSHSGSSIGLNDRQRDGRSREHDQGRKRGAVAGGAAAVAGGVSSLFGGRARQQGKVPRSFDTIGSTPSYAQQHNRGLASTLEGINLPLVLAIVAALIIVIIVAVVVSNGARQSAEDVPAIPISGLTDTSSPEDENALDATTLTPPTQVVFEYEVKDGQKVWIEVYQNGNANPVVSGKEEGPKTETFEVTDTLEFKTPNPNAVICKLDGAEVDLTPNSQGEYVFEVNFQDYLAQWEVDHGLRSSASSSSSSSSSSTSSKSSSSSSKSSKSSSSSSSSRSSSSATRSS